MAEKEIPSWVDDTPEEQTYGLVMWEGDGGGSEQVDITRAEYIALKQHLAAMRGYLATSVAAVVAKINESDCLDGYSCSDDQQVARHLETARDFYRCFPDAVVWQSDEFDGELAKLAL